MSGYRFDLNKGQQNTNVDTPNVVENDNIFEQGESFDSAPKKKESKFAKFTSSLKTKSEPKEKVDFSTKLKRLSSKMRRRQVAIMTAAFAVVFALIAALGYNTYRGKQEAMALGTELKLDIFNGLDQFGEEILTGDIDDLMDFAMGIIDKTLEENNIKLTPSERAALEQKVRDAIMALIDQGLLEFDENGHLTDTSKAYLVNTIVNTLLNAFPQLDLDSVLGSNTTSTTDYKKILDLQGTIDEIGNMNQDIINAGDQINQLLELIYGDNYESIDIQTLKDFLNAMQTLIDMEQWKKIEELIEGSDTYITQEELTKILQELKLINGDSIDYTEKFASIMKKLEAIIGSMDEGDVNLEEIIKKYNALQELLKTLDGKNSALEQLIKEMEGTNITNINDLSTRLTELISSTSTEITNNEEKTWNDFKKAYNKYVEENNTNIENVKKELQLSIQETNDTINATIENVVNTFNSTYEAFSELTTENYNTLSKYLGYLNSYLNKSLTHLETDTDTRISEIEAYVDRYLRMAGNTEVQTIEPKDKEFEFSGSAGDYTLIIDGNDFDKAEDGSNKLEGAFIADVYYFDPYYNLAPSYALDAQAGTLTIKSPTVPADGKIKITSIIISRNVQNEIDWTQLDATSIITLATQIKEYKDEHDPNNKLSVVDISVELENASKKGYEELVETISKYLNADVTDPAFEDFDYGFEYNYNHIEAIDDYTHRISTDDGHSYTESHVYDPDGKCVKCGHVRGTPVDGVKHDYSGD